MNSPIGLYISGDTWLHRLHPLTKLVICLAVVIVTFGGPGKWTSATIPGLLAFLLLWRAGLVYQNVQRSFHLLLPVAVVLLVVHGLFNPYNHTIILKFGHLKIGKEGLIFATLVILRLLGALAGAFVLVSTTHPIHLIKGLTDAGLPDKLAFLLANPLMLLPQMANRINSIQAAQQARGLETQGAFIQRVRALFPLVAPLIFSSLIDVEERSLALEVRGFNAPGNKTSLIELYDTWRQKIARQIMILLSVGFLVVGIFWRAHGGY